jgi:hypothetical protein
MFVVNPPEELAERPRIHDERGAIVPLAYSADVPGALAPPAETAGQDDALAFVQCEAS